MRNIKNNTGSKAAGKGLAFLLIIILALSAFAAVLTTCPIWGREKETGVQQTSVEQKKTTIETQVSTQEKASGDFSSKVEDSSNEIVEVVEEVIGGEAVNEVGETITTIVNEQISEVTNLTNLVENEENENEAEEEDVENEMANEDVDDEDEIDEDAGDAESDDMEDDTEDTTPVNLPPVADAGEDQTIYVYDIIQFDGSNSCDLDGFIFSYEWDFGDGTTGNGIRAIHMYTANGTYTVLLTVTDYQGAKDEDTCVVTVNNCEGNMPLLINKAKVSGLDFIATNTYYEWELSITVINMGGSDITNVVVEDALREELEVINYAVTQGTLDLTTVDQGTKFVWTVGTLSSEEDATLTISICTVINEEAVQEFALPGSYEILNKTSVSCLDSLTNHAVRGVYPDPVLVMVLDDDNHKSKNFGETATRGSPTYVSGSISGTWSAANSPYIVTGSTYVYSGKTLTIEPGVEVRFNAYCVLYVYGTLNAVGTESNMITFTSNKTTKARGDWYGIYYQKGSLGTIQYCVVEYAYYGIRVYYAPITISNSIIRHNKEGIYCYYSAATISDNEITDCYSGSFCWDAGIYLAYSSATVTRNTITNNDCGIYSYGCSPTISYNTIIGGFVQSGGWGYSGSNYGTYGYHAVSLSSSSPTMIRNTITGGSGTYQGGIGISMYYSSPTIISNVITGGSGGSYGRMAIRAQSSSSPTIINSTITGGSGGYSNGLAIYCYYYSYATTLNTTFDKTSVYIGYYSTLTIKWYLHVKVVNRNNMPISGANVVVKDKNNNQINNGNTGSDGYVKWIVCTEYVQSSSTKTFYTPHQVSATKDIRTNYASPEPNINMSKEVVIILSWGDIQPPVANAGLDQTVYTNEEVIFNTSNSYDTDGTIVGYYWDFDDGTVGTGATPTRSYGDDGIYTVTLTVTDDDGATSSDTCSITVLNCLPIANAGVDQTGYKNVVIQFDGAQSYDPDGVLISYIWNFGDATSGSAIITTHVYYIAGTYTVTLTVTDDDCATATDTCVITVLNKAPIASADIDQTVYTNVAVSFDASGSYDSDGSITSYAWDFGDGATGTGVTTTHTYTDDGVYTVTLTVTDDDGATATDSCNITVLNRAPVASAGLDQTVYKNEIVQFDASQSYDPDGTIVSYSWDFGDGATATGSIVTHAYPLEGTYTVTLTVVDDDGATSNDTCVITVPNRVPVLEFINDQTAYLGKTFELQVIASDADNDPLTFSDDTELFDVNSTTGLLSFKPTGKDKGAHIITITVSDGTDSVSDAFTLTIITQGADNGGSGNNDNNGNGQGNDNGNGNGQGNDDDDSNEEENDQQQQDAFLYTLSITLRVAGTPGNTVTLVVNENSVSIAEVTVVREAGNPNEQAETLTVDIYENRSYEFVLRYNSSGNGDNPVKLTLEVTANGAVSTTNLNLNAQQDVQEVILSLEELLAGNGNGNNNNENGQGNNNSNNDNGNGGNDGNGQGNNNDDNSDEEDDNGDDNQGDGNGAGQGNENGNDNSGNSNGQGNGNNNEDGGDGNDNGGGNDEQGNDNDNSDNGNGGGQGNGNDSSGNGHGHN